MLGQLADAHYRVACQESFYQGQHFYEISEVSIMLKEPNTYQRKAHFYLDADCQILAADLNEDGLSESYSFRDERGPHLAIGVALTNSYFRPELQELVTVFAQIKFCGRDDWQLGFWSSTLPTQNLTPQELGPETQDVGSLVRTECAGVPLRCINLRLIKELSRRID